jgi:fumarylacetoacetase
MIEIIISKTLAITIVRKTFNSRHHPPPTTAPMSDSHDHASHFGINNIPYSIASSPTRPKPQAVTRISNTILFLFDLSTTTPFNSISIRNSTSLSEIFLQPTLNAFAALPKTTHAQIRSAIQEAYNSNLHTDSSEDIDAVTLHLPLQIGDFTDYSASRAHVLNASGAVTGTPSYPPGFHAYPVGYAGRCSSIGVSPARVTRPSGQFIEDYGAAEKKIVFGASRALDYELEIGAVIGRPVEAGSYLEAKDADEHIFGFVLLNDWSARDIQGLEMNPLGPFNGKNFKTTISPWIVTLEALQPYAVPAPERMKPVADFMDDDTAPNYEITLISEVERKGARTTTCTVGFETMYWTFRHMLAHHTVGGCGLRTGDLIASGTVSGEGEHEHGCLLELTRNGREAVKLSDDSELRYLQDGDEVVYVGYAGSGHEGVGFGAIVGVVEPARQW